jgi:hypothetical protein
LQRKLGLEYKRIGASKLPGEECDKPPEKVFRLILALSRNCHASLFKLLLRQSANLQGQCDE